MSKQLTSEQWLTIINIYKRDGIIDAVNSYHELKKLKNGDLFLKDLKSRIKSKGKLLDNLGMKIFIKSKGSGRPRKRDDSDIPSIIDRLNDEQMREIVEDWIKEQRNKKDKTKVESISNLSHSMKAEVLNMHRTSMYKKRTSRKYKFEYLKERVIEIFNDNKCIYGSRKISIVLSFEDIVISDRTLRNYMIRWGLATLTRKKHKKSEQKNTTVRYPNLVQRNYNPVVDNIVATDVSYIPANTDQNFVYLSAAISHKTKMIESWKLSKLNNTELVVQTINGLQRKDFILHSDHGVQYSTPEVIAKLKTINSQTSMSRVGNSLDNREIEYFFSCLKGEYLNNIKTKNMEFEEIYNHISEYIEWYNFSRIQKRLNWKAPAFASAINL